MSNLSLAFPQPLAQRYPAANRGRIRRVGKTEAHHRKVLRESIPRRVVVRWTERTWKDFDGPRGLQGCGEQVAKVFAAGLHETARCRITKPGKSLDKYIVRGRFA